MTDRDDHKPLRSSRSPTSAFETAAMTGVNVERAWSYLSCAFLSSPCFRSGHTVYNTGVAN